MNSVSRGRVELAGPFFPTLLLDPESKSTLSNITESHHAQFIPFLKQKLKFRREESILVT